MKKFFFSVVLIIFSLLIVYIGGEILVRLISKSHFRTPAELGEESLQYRATVFARHAFKTKKIDASGWGDSVWHINPKGYRGLDFTPGKSDDTIRVMIYGGSAVFDPHADGYTDWPFQVQQILRNKGYPKAEVINAGVPGHASYDSFGRFFAEGHLFQPDYVILENAWNDLKGFHQDISLLRFARPYVIEKDKRLTYHNWLDRKMCELSELYLQLRSRYYQKKYGAEGKRFKDKEQTGITVKALTQYERTFELFSDLAQNIGATPIFIKQPRLVTAKLDEELRALVAEDYLPFSYATAVEAFTKTDQIIDDVAARKNVYVIDASKFMTGKAEMFSDHVHLTKKGSATMAQIVAENLIQAFQRNTNPSVPLAGL